MALQNNYVGRQFGQFRIDNIIGQGDEINIFSCLHHSTGRSYILRLDSHDKNIWPEGPNSFPNNLKIEKKAIESTRLATTNHSNSKNAIMFMVPEIYGVFEQKYLVPVASLFRVKAAWDVDKLFQTPINANIHSYFMLWEDVISYIIGDAFIALDSSERLFEWEKKWGLLLGGKILVESVTQFIANGSSGKDEQSKVIAMVSSAAHEDTFLVDNLLFRICACIERGKLSAEEAIATLECKHFRVNISYHEIQQMLNLYTILVSQEVMPPENSITLIGFVLAQLEKDPVDMDTDPGKFEKRDFLPYDRFNLFFQEDPKFSQEVITLIPN
jgi:hypothetical protein